MHRCTPSKALQPRSLLRFLALLFAGLTALAMTSCAEAPADPPVAQVPTPEPLTPESPAPESAAPDPAEAEWDQEEIEAALLVYEEYELALMSVVSSGASDESLELARSYVQAGGTAEDELNDMAQEAKRAGTKRISGGPFVDAYRVLHYEAGRVSLDVCWNNSETRLEGVDTPGVYRILPDLVAIDGEWKVEGYAGGIESECGT